MIDFKKIMLFFFALFIIGCTANYGLRNNGGKEVVTYRTGVTGLTMEFLKGTPPPKIFEGDTFPIMLKVKNNGAYDIENDEAVVSLGVERDYTSGIKLLEGGKVKKSPAENAAMLSLEGKTQINPIGQEEIISYNIDAGLLDPQSESHISTAIANLCYPYETILESTICIDTDINNLRPTKKVCSLKNQIFSSGQGAPVAITKIEMNMLPTKDSGQNFEKKIIPQFLIYVEDRGKGTVIRREAVKDFCIKSDTSHKDLNIIYVDAELSNKPLQCQLDVEEGQRGHIKLKDKKDIIWCSLREGISATQDSFTSPLKVTLSYGYSQSIATSYLIQKTAR